MHQDAHKEVDQYAVLMHMAQAFAYYLGYRYHKKRNKNLYKWLSVAGIIGHSAAALLHTGDLMWERKGN